MPSAVRGMLVECDPSIHALILNIDSRSHDIIIEELDETHLLIDATKMDYLKNELNSMLDENTFNPAEAEAS
uniref:General transcription and DNA repair factor IIH subunit TFB5 n=1 Tax=Blastobotrys adeninivorans TaxID=409370 RepID=A0A060TID9_BLAAD